MQDENPMVNACDDSYASGRHMSKVYFSKTAAKKEVQKEATRVLKIDIWLWKMGLRKFLKLAL